MNKYIPLKELEVYQLSRELSRLAWGIYQEFSFEDKKVMGDQFVRSMDSVGANIAEGYGRYHCLDRIRFYYNARASLHESCDHWLELLHERQKISLEKYKLMNSVKEKLSLKLSNFINATYKLSDNEKK